MSNVKAQSSNQVQIPKFKITNHLELDICHSFDICLPARSPALRGEGRDFGI
jgi:hypothetical protein